MHQRADVRGLLSGPRSHESDLGEIAHALTEYPADIVQAEFKTLLRGENGEPVSNDADSKPIAGK